MPADPPVAGEAPVGDAPKTDEPQTAMMLTDTEWKMLASICFAYLSQSPAVAPAAPDHAALANRIIEAASW